MASRPNWKGYLKLSLVACAVELTGATTSTEKVKFRVINRATGNTVRRQFVDAVSGTPVDPADEVKGYEIGKDEFLLVEDEEIDALQIESSHTLNIESFVDKQAIEQIYLDTPYFVTPADEVATEAFAVIREAMARKGKAGLARIVLFRRERPAVIEPLGEGLLLTTLRYAMMVRRPEDVMGDIGTPRLDEEMVALAGHIIDQKKGAFDPATFEDRYEQAIMDLVRARQAGREPPKVRAGGRPSNVVNLFDALKRSIAADGGAASAGPAKSAGKPPAEAAGASGGTPAKPAARPAAGPSAKAGGKEQNKQPKRSPAKASAKVAASRTPPREAGPGRPASRRRSA
ncbi:MAG: Ku protein [Burkholderiales bacterium]|nr:Ku protein [Burkholderiales bacterium]